jgi:hypothetical protein
MRYCVTIVLLISYTLTNAQIGLKVGGQSTMIGGYDTSPEFKSEYLTGWVAGVTFGGYRDKTSLRVEVLFSQRGDNFSSFSQSSFESGEVYTLSTKYTNRLSYIEVPVVFTMPIVRHLRFEMGVTPAVCVAGTRNGRSTLTWNQHGATRTYVFEEQINYFDQEVFPDYTQFIDKKEEGILYPNKRPLKYFDLSLHAGMSYHIIPQLAIQGRYAWGVVDVFQNNYPVPNASTRREVHRIMSVALVYIINPE